MGAFKKPVRLGLIVGSRLFFNGAPALASHEQAIDQFGKLGIAVKTLPADATENGAVQSREDAAPYGDFFREHARRDRRARDPAAEFRRRDRNFRTRQRGALNVPILLQASNDEIDKVDVKSRRDAFCGKFSVDK